jgi:membrane-associated protein
MPYSPKNEMIKEAIDFVLHVDKFLLPLIDTFGPLIYLILFLIILFETGLVITPFLPGDSLLFVVGALAAQEVLNVFLLYIFLLIAAILGDSLNYWIGNYFGEKVFRKSRFFKKEYLEKTKYFYKKHGGKAIILARFVPVARTFVPFVAGIGKMNYKKFIPYNILGGFLWVTSFLWAGYFFGNLPFVKENLTFVILAIIIISILPGFMKYLISRYQRKI